MTIDIELDKHLGLVQRRVEVGERDGRPVHVVKASRTYDTEIDDVWDAITNPERIPRWFLPVSGALREGGRFQLEGNAGGEITRCDPPRELSVTWEFGGDTSWVSVVLSQVKPGATRLELQHTAHVPDDFWTQYGPGATGVGWDLAIVGLAEHLWGAADVDHKEAEQWPATPDGRKLVEHCAQAWCAAQVAAGGAEPAAQAAAARTIAFYTGQPDPTAAG